jgi:hypothetical protein
MAEITKIETHCKDCYWANPSDQQPRCHLGRAEKYIQLGVKHEEVDGYYKFEGRFCAAKRSKEWAEGVGNPLGVIDNELRQPVDVIVVFEDSKKLEDLEVTVNAVSLYNYPQKYGTIHVICPWNRYAEIRQWMEKRFAGTELSKAWFITRVTLDFMTDFYKLVDMGFRKVTTPYYLAIAAGLKPPEKVTDWLHQQVNHDLRQLLLAYPEEGDWYVASTRVHKQMSGNDRDETSIQVEGQDEPVEVNLPSLPAKVQYFADLTNNPALIEQVDFV